MNAKTQLKLNAAFHEIIRQAQAGLEAVERKDASKAGEALHTIRCWGDLPWRHRADVKAAFDYEG